MNQSQINQLRSILNRMREISERPDLTEEQLCQLEEIMMHVDDVFKLAGVEELIATTTRNHD